MLRSCQRHINLCHNTVRVFVTQFAIRVGWMDQNRACLLYFGNLCQVCVQDYISDAPRYVPKMVRILKRPTLCGPCD